MGNGMMTGLLTGLIDPTGTVAIFGIAAGGIIGFTSSFAGDAVGHFWDDEPEVPFASIPLFNFVVGLLLTLPYLFVVLLAHDRIERPRVALCVFVGVANLIAGAGARLIEDIRVRMDSVEEVEEEGESNLGRGVGA